MLCNQVTERGHSNWAELSLAEKYGCAAWAADWLTRHQQKSEISDAAIRVGAGPREKRHVSGKRYLTGEVALTIEVADKLPASWCGDRLISDFLQLQVPTNNGRRVLAIPTDVRESQPTPVAQADSFKFLSESGDGHPAIKGSFCALVKNTSGNTDLRYVLTCHHVAFLSLLDSAFVPDTTAKAFHQAGSAKSSEMGKSSRGTNLNPEPQFSLDAALIRLADASPARTQSFWPVAVTAWVQDPGDIGLAFAHDARIYNRKLNGQPIEFSALRSDLVVDYPGGGRARFSQLIEYRLPSGLSTQGGDSGGALVADRFKLIGMHIAGIGRLGFAIPAYQLFRTIAFSPSIIPAIPTAG